MSDVMSDGTTLGRDLAAPVRPTSRRQLVRRAVLAAVGLAALLGAGRYARYWWSEGRFVESTDDAYVGGNVTAIAPHVAGFVERVLVADNQRVRAGDLLIQLDARDYRAALDHARAVVAAHDAALAGLAARRTLQRSAIRQAAADLASRTAQSTFAVLERERYRYLAQTSAGSRQEAQRTLAGDAQARASVDGARAALEGAQQQMAVLDAAYAEEAAAGAQARAALRTAELDLGYTEIRAPVDGYVGSRAAQVGAYVAAGAYLLSVIPAAGLWVDANFKEDQLAHMRPGQAARVVADVLPDRVLHGRVLSLAPGTGAVFSVIPPENATGNFTKIVQRVPVRIALDDGDSALGPLRPGLSITAWVDTRGVP